MTNAQDCSLDWLADFGKMEILLYVSIISPGLILNFLTMLPKRDERFQQTGITDALQLSSRFNIKLITQSQGNDICFDLRIFSASETFAQDSRLELELV